MRSRSATATSSRSRVAWRWLVKDSEALRAGLKPGDVIVRFGGDEVRDVRYLRNRVAVSAPGTKINIELIRDGKPMMVTATIAKQAEDASAAESAPPARRSDKLGIAVSL